MGDNQLKLLMDYTLFHIKAYIALGTLLVALLGLDGFKQHATAMRPYLVVTLVCFMIAGLFGGIVASSLPHYRQFSDFESAKLGPWFWPKALRSKCCTALEHSAFWIGIFVAFFGLLRL